MDDHDTLDAMMLPLVVDCYGTETVDCAVELDLVGLSKPMRRNTCRPRLDDKAETIRSSMYIVVVSSTIHSLTASPRDGITISTAVQEQTTSRHDSDGCTPPDRIAQLRRSGLNKVVCLSLPTTRRAKRHHPFPTTRTMVVSILVLDAPNSRETTGG